MEPVIVTCPTCDADIDITESGISAEDGQGFFYCGGTPQDPEGCKPE